MVNLTTIVSVAGASFVASFVEAVEALTIVLAVGTVRGWRPAGLGAVAGSRCLRPENTLKFVVGVMLSAFGVFWIGEGFGIDWPGEDIAIIAFAALFLVVALGTAALTRRVGREALQ